MEITGISNINPTSQNADVSIKVLKKALDIEQQGAQQLIEAIPDLSSPIGQNVNIKV